MRHFDLLQSACGVHLAAWDEYLAAWDEWRKDQR